jgi:hypothetical protein
MQRVTEPRLVARKALLLASVSMIALAVASPDLRAQQQQSSASTTGAPQGQSSVWSEAGLTGQPATDPAIGLPPYGPFANVGPGAGWTAAVGFDYQPAQGSPYLVSGQFRYDQNNGASVPTSSPVTGTATLNKGTLWLADLAVGLGFGNTQVKLGTRVAELASTANASGLTTVVVLATPVTGNISFQSRSQFLGVGPQLSIDGSAPLGGSWAFDYLGGVAVLLGNRSLNATQTFSSTNVFLLPSSVTTLYSSSTVGVPNLEVQAGISYWLTPNFKLTASYRFDGYWNALTVIEPNGQLAQQNQYYYGPVLRGTVTF